MNAPPRKRVSKLQELLAFDQHLLETINEERSHFLHGVIGADEVGRGSLVGPVVAAAFCFPGEIPTDAESVLADLDDSKASHFTHTKRLTLADHLKTIGFWGLGEASKEEVETLNVSKASLLASYRAIEQLGLQFSQCRLSHHLVVLDGRSKIPGLPYVQIPKVKADAQSAAVAAASVIAKAYRDEMMIHLAKQYPGYQWETNAGYPTPGHQAALVQLGITPLHRTTYKVIRELVETQQQRLLSI